MSYRIETTEADKQVLIIDGWEKGIASSPYLGIGNIRNINTSYYPGVGYVNYRRRAATTSGSGFYAGTHSTNVSGNEGWVFAAPSSTTPANPLHKAVSPAGIIYILDSLGQIWKQSAVNSTTFNELEGGTGRMGIGSGGLAFWNNYLVVFGDGLIEFCGDGTGDAGVLSTNWNLNTSGTAKNTTAFVTSASLPNDNLYLNTPDSTLSRPKFVVNDPVQFTTTGGLPAPLAINTTYYIESISYNLDTGSGSGPFTLTDTIGGSAISITSAGTGVHTMTDYATLLPLGNCTNLVISGSTTKGTTSLAFSSYVNPVGVTQGSKWLEASGVYALVFPDGTRISGTFTNGSGTISLTLPLEYLPSTADGQINVQILDSTATTYKTWLSKADGNLYFANGRSLGRILSQNENIAFNPGLYSTFTVNYAVTKLLQPGDTIVDMTDLKSTMVVAGNKDIYTWDYVSSNMSAPSPVDEQIVGIANLLNNIYVLAGEKGNIYISNGYSAQVFFKIPDFIAGVIDPVWKFGGLMVRRAKLYFQALAKTTAGVNILAGIFSLNVSPTTANDTNMSNALIMEAENSYGLTPASGAASTGLLIDNSPSANGNDSYYSAWSNGSVTGGIDYNDTSLWQNWEPTIETDIIPIGTILEKKTFGNIEFKLDRPLVSGDQIRMYFRTSLSDSYTLMGTTTTAQLSDYYKSNIFQSQWVQFKVQMKCASSSSSFIPLREVRLYYN